MVLRASVVSVIEDIIYPSTAALEKYGCLDLHTLPEGSGPKWQSFLKEYICLAFWILRISSGFIGRLQLVSLQERAELILSL